VLQRRAAELLRLEAATRAELRGEEAELQVRIAGPEVLLSRVAPELAKRILSFHPKANFELAAGSEAEVAQRVAQGSVHLGLTTGAIPKGVEERKILHTVFQTCVGRGHPLHKAARGGQVVPVEVILRHAFVAPDRAVLGTTDAAQSPDGWRDDKFPRRIGYVTTSLATIEELVTSGAALAYLPDYYAEQIPVATLKISGCPYSCKQTVSMMARAPETAGWLSRLFS
jgi:DNA-binding transcriptional LysR family regulator